MRGKPVRRRWWWRRRSNPLLRRDDVVEAWIVLVVWVVVAVGGTVTGLLTAHAADEVFARQRAERRPVRAVLLSDLSKATSTARPSDEKAVAKVRWTAPDGSARTGRTLVDAGLRPGTRLVVWQDPRGTLVTAPPNSTKAGVEAGVLGALAGLAVTGAVHAVGALARWRLDRRRIDAWGREWDLVGSQWGHRTG